MINNELNLNLSIIKSIYGVSQVGNRSRQLGKCSKCKLYSKCKGVKSLCDPFDNPKKS